MIREALHARRGALPLAPLDLSSCHAVQNNEDRNFLFGLDAGAKGLLAKHGRSDELDLIFQAYSNILRRLGD